MNADSGTKAVGSPPPSSAPTDGSDGPKVCPECGHKGKPVARNAFLRLVYGQKLGRCEEHEHDVSGLGSMPCGCRHVFHRVGI